MANKNMYSFECKPLTGNMEINRKYWDIFSSQIDDQTVKSVEKKEKLSDIYRDHWECLQYPLGH